MIDVRADGIGKAYHFYAKPIDSLKEWLLRRPYHETFWALRDLTFSLPRGQSLGVVGENGAGKSTLLKLLAGTIAPTCGRLERNGRVSAVLELGSGFHPELSGLENIRIGCAVLGLSPKETEQRVPEIIAFSELRDFIARPIKTYSTGMYVRLAFSIVTSVEPEILVVDEALSVGDQHFQKKCIDRMMSFREQGKTLIFCSHTLHYINQICDRCLWLRHGRLEMLGLTAEVTKSYQDYERARDVASASASPADRRLSVDGTRGDNYLREVTLGGDCRDGNIETGAAFTVRIIAHLTSAAVGDAHLAVVIFGNDNTMCYGVSTEMDHATLYPLNGTDYGATFVVKSLPLLAGQYTLKIFLLDGSGLHVYDWKILPFFVQRATNEVGLARLQHSWERP